MDRDRFFGGNPVGVLIRLALLSIVVGIVMSALGISPRNLFYHLELLARRIYEMGFGAFEWLFHYLLIGAVVVVPIWLVARVLRTGASRRDRDG